MKNKVITEKSKIFKTEKLIWNRLNFSLVIKHVDLLLKVHKDTDSVDSKMITTKNGRTILSSKCAVCRIKKSRFVKEQETKRLLSSLGLKTLLSKVPLSCDILFSIK